MKTQEEYYAKRAKEHDLVYEKPERQADLAQLRQILPGLFTGKRLLDIGCGPGYWSQVLSQSTRSIHGVDINRSVLEVARSRHYDCPTSFAEGSYYDLRVEGQYEGLFGGFIYSHVEKVKRSLLFTNLLQALQMGGTGVLIDNLFVPGSSTPISRVDAAGNHYQNRRLQSGEEYEVLKNFPTEDEWDFLADFGLSEYSFRKLRYYWILTFQK